MKVGVKMMAEMTMEMVASKIPEKKVTVNVVHPECKVEAEAEAAIKPEETARVMMAQVVMLKMVIRVQVDVADEADVGINHPDVVDGVVAAEAEAFQIVNSQMGQVVQVDPALAEMWVDSKAVLIHGLIPMSRSLATIPGTLEAPTLVLAMGVVVVVAVEAVVHVVNVLTAEVVEAGDMVSLTKMPLIMLVIGEMTSLKPMSGIMKSILVH